MENHLSERVSTNLAVSELSERCGCQAKLDGETLACVVGEAFDRTPEAGIPPTSNIEDCAVLPPATGALLASVDFGPLVYSALVRAGRIAATHALSDVYACGGSPTAALAILVVRPELQQAAIADLLAGLTEGCTTAGVALVGGQTIVGEETIVGLTVLGEHPSQPLSKHGARVGDHLLLSKPLGVGVMLRAFRQGILGPDQVEPALTSMEGSNRTAAEAALSAEASAATDVTGFGLLGHLAEMVDGSGLGARLELDRIPEIAGVRMLPEQLFRSTWIERNVDYCAGIVGISAPTASQGEIGLLADPQTSGGLLVSVAPERAPELTGKGFSQIGVVTDSNQLEVV